MTEKFQILWQQSLGINSYRVYNTGGSETSRSQKTTAMLSLGMLLNQQLYEHTYGLLSMAPKDSLHEWENEEKESICCR